MAAKSSPPLPPTATGFLGTISSPPRRSHGVSTSCSYERSDHPPRITPALGADDTRERICGGRIDRKLFEQIVGYRRMFLSLIPLTIHLGGLRTGGLT